MCITCSDDSKVSNVNHSCDGSARSTITTACSESSLEADSGVSNRLVNRVPPPSSQM